MIPLPWGRIAAGLLLVAGLASAGAWAWRTRGHIADLERNLATANQKVERAAERIAARDEALKACNDSAAQAAADAADYKRRLDLELAKPPRVLIRYRDALPAEPPITAAECPDAVAQLLGYVRELAAAETEDPNP